MSIVSCISSSLVRYYPGSPLPRRRITPVLEGALNERLSFQVVIRSDDPTPRNVSVSATAPGGCSVIVRRVGYVPMPHFNTQQGGPEDIEGAGHVPGFVPDPLFEETSFLLPGNEAHAFWISFIPGRNAVPGRKSIKVTVAPEGEKKTVHCVPVRLHGLRLKKRRNFHAMHWFYVDSLIDWYGTDMFDKRFWEILPAYVRNVSSHGLDAIYVPVFTPPLDGVKRPSQLLHVRKRGKRYDFDWRDVEKYVRLVQECGITHFEWCHLFTQWGVKNAIRVYENQGKEEKLLWPASTGAVSPTYRNFLSQFLPELRQFLSRHRIANKSFFHLSDEPHGPEHLASYRKARALLRELAPWMEVMDALTEIDYGREHLTDMPVPSIKTAIDFVKEDIPSWCYYCCAPRGRYLNRLMDTPLSKIAMHGFMFYRWPFKGFLHWGYNYWYESQTRNLIDPFTVQDGTKWPGWAYGDTFVVYPGNNGPLDSIRWEIFGEALQDYALLQTLGIERNDPLFRSLRNFEDFPKTPGWRTRMRARLLKKRQ